MMRAERLPLRLLEAASLAKWLPAQAKEHPEVASPQLGDRHAPRGAAWLSLPSTQHPRLRARARVRCGTPPYLCVLHPPLIPTRAASCRTAS